MAQLIPLVSLHHPLIVGTSTRQSALSVLPFEPHAKACVAVAVLVAVCVAVWTRVSVTVMVRVCV
jgi:small neutral amino acid transporter SnatA (MarC family)